MAKFENYYNDIQEAAKMILNETKADLLETAKEGSFDFYLFFDDVTFSHTDTEFIHLDIRDHANIIFQSSNVETDSGLWEGQSPEQSISTQAFFTYRNDLLDDLYDRVMNLLEDELFDIDEEIVEKEREVSIKEEKLEEKEEGTKEYNDLYKELLDLQNELDDLQEVYRNLKKSMSQ